MPDNTQWGKENSTEKINKMESDTPETDSAWESYSSSATDGDPWGLATKLERERNEARLQNTRLRSALLTLINLNNGIADGGDGITGEDWEIAGYALELLENSPSEANQAAFPPLDDASC